MTYQGLLIECVRPRLTHDGNVKLLEASRGYWGLLGGTGGYLCCHDLITVVSYDFFVELMRYQPWVLHSGSVCVGYFSRCLYFFGKHPLCLNLPSHFFSKFL